MSNPKLKNCVISCGLFSMLVFASDVFASEGGSSPDSLLASIGIAILAATVMAFIAHYLKQPLLLAYIAAGVIIGPKNRIRFHSE